MPMKLLTGCGTTPHKKSTKRTAEGIYNDAKTICRRLSWSLGLEFERQDNMQEATWRGQANLEGSFMDRVGGSLLASNLVGASPNVDRLRQRGAMSPEPAKRPSCRGARRPALGLRQSGPTRQGRLLLRDCGHFGRAADEHFGRSGPITWQYRGVFALHRL